MRFSAVVLFAVLVGCLLCFAQASQAPVFGPQVYRQSQQRTVTSYRPFTQAGPAMQCSGGVCRLVNRQRVQSQPYVAPLWVSPYRQRSRVLWIR